MVSPARQSGLHLDDRHIRVNGESLSASIVDMTFYTVTNHKALLDADWEPGRAPPRPATRVGLLRGPVGLVPHNFLWS